MNMTNKTMMTYAGLALFGILGPILFPQYTLSIAYLWMMVLMASTWDTLGGQMGYNSLGNITFFGVGMYVSAIVQILSLIHISEPTRRERQPRRTAPR